jgi:hypothetical protein
MNSPTTWLEKMISFFKQRPVNINPSTGATSNDANYGDGWYFTDMTPAQYTKTQVAQALWDKSFRQNLRKTEYFIEVKLHGNTAISKGRPHVFLVPITSKAQTIITRHGRNDSEE